MSSCEEINPKNSPSKTYVVGPQSTSHHPKRQSKSPFVLPRPNLPSSPAEKPSCTAQQRQRGVTRKPSSSTTATTNTEQHASSSANTSTCLRARIRQPWAMGWDAGLTRMSSCEEIYPNKMPTKTNEVGPQSTSLCPKRQSKSPFVLPRPNLQTSSAEKPSCTAQQRQQGVTRKPSSSTTETTNNAQHASSSTNTSTC